MVVGLVVWLGAYPLHALFLVVTSVGLGARPQTFELVYGLGYEWMGEGHLRRHPLVNLPLNAFLHT